MKRMGGWLKSLLGLAALGALTILLIALLSQAANSRQGRGQSAQATSPIQPPAPTPTTEVVPTPTSPQAEQAFQSPLQPPREERTPIPVYTPTLPPFPTAIPTPIVTPIPTVALPAIPDVEGKPQQPFWIYYWQGNEVWRVDSQGQDRELLLDTLQSLGQWLTEFPRQYKGTEITAGPRVNVSPDGKKLALVVVDKIELAAVGDPFTLSIYAFDVEKRDLKLVGREGFWPVWSPDGRRIAFREQGGCGGLWVADLETGQVYERLAKHKEPDMCFAEHTWSPDGTQIAYMYSQGLHPLIPEILVVNADDDVPPRQLMSLDPLIYIGVLKWSPDGQEIFFLSAEGAKGWSEPHRVFNLWSISLATGERTQLTHDMRVGGYSISPHGEWLLFPGFHIYEPRQGHINRDLWLMRLDGQDLRWVTANRDWALVEWSPDGTGVVVTRENKSPLLLSLEDGATSVLDLAAGTDFTVGGTR